MKDSELNENIRGILGEQDFDQVDFGGPPPAGRPYDEYEDFTVDDINWTLIGPSMLDAYGSAGYAQEDFMEAGMPHVDPDDEAGFVATFEVAAEELNRRLKEAGLLPPDYDEVVRG